MRVGILFTLKSSCTRWELNAQSSEFIAMKSCVEHKTALRFKLLMFGIPIHAPRNTLCDNESLVNQALCFINRKSFSSCGYFVAAMQLVKISPIATKGLNIRENIVNIL